MIQNFISGKIYAVFLIVLLLVGCEKASDVKPGKGMEKPQAPVAGMDEEMLKKIQLEFVPDTSPDAVPMKTLESVADEHAKAIWGPEVVRGTPLQLLDDNGKPEMYAFPFAVNVRTIPETDELIKQFSYTRRVSDSLSAGSDNKANGLSSSVKMEAARYGTVYVSARRSDFPVRKVSHALHPYFYNAERALSSVGSDTARLVALRSMPPYEFFEIKKGESTIRLDTHMLTSDEEIRRAVKELSDRAKTEPESTRRIDARKVKEAWKAYEKASSASQASSATHVPPPPPPNPDVVFKIAGWQLMPAINWTRWCEPTAVSMVFAFWDHYVPDFGTNIYFPRLVDYWYEHPSNGNNVPDIIDPIADDLNINVTNNLKGYNWTVDKVIGNSSNGFAWNELRDHLRLNRPFVWQVHGSMDHATAAFGYRIHNGQAYILLYSTWSDDPNLAYEEWLYNDWTHVEVDRYRPGGWESDRYVFITKPYGGETFHIGQWNKVEFYMSPQTAIEKVRIEYSLNAGQSWHFMVETWAHPEWNTWWWKPSIASSKARIRVKGMTTNNTYLGGDGSFSNFVIQ